MNTAEIHKAMSEFHRRFGSGTGWLLGTLCVLVMERWLKVKIYPDYFFVGLLLMGIGMQALAYVRLCGTYRKTVLWWRAPILIALLISPALILDGFIYYLAMRR